MSLDSFLVPAGEAGRATASWANVSLRAALVLAVCLVVVGVAHWLLRRVLRRWQDRPVTAGGLSRGDRVAVTVIVSLATVFVLVAFAMSAAALHDSATWLRSTAIPINGGDLRFLFPLVLDGLIIMFLALDLWTEWRGMRHPYYRWVAYSLSVLTLYLNVRHGGGGSLLGHAAPPLGVIVISEGLAIWIRSMAKMIDTGKTTDRVPLGHWVARPTSAFRVSRLMLGWNVASYEDAVAMDRRRSMAYAMLRQQHGKAWRRQTPEHVRWMLDNGFDLDVAYDLTRAMTRSRVAMTPDEVASEATGDTGRVDVVEVDDTPTDTPVGDSDTRRSLLSRMVVASGHDRLAGGRDTPAIESDTPSDTSGDTTPAIEATPDTAQATANVAPDVAPTEEATRPVASLSDMAERDRQVVSWLIEDPDMSGAEIGRRVGATSKTGQRLRKRLEPVARQEAGGDTSGEGDTRQATGDATGDTTPGGWRVKRTKDAASE